MGSTDWTFLNDGLDIATVDRGVTAGIARPPGGGNFVYAFNSLAAVQGTVGLFANLVDFAPMAKGGSIRGCLQRGPSGGTTGFAPYFFLAAQGPSVHDTAYLLGLSDTDPHRIVLRKGAPAAGTRARAPAARRPARSCARSLDSRPRERAPRREACTRAPREGQGSQAFTARAGTGTLPPPRVGSEQPAPVPGATDHARAQLAAVLDKRIPLLKTDEERYVLGVVLEPETVDAQNDIYSAAEVRDAAHRFMQEYQNVGLMHRELVNSQVKILESYLAPTSFEIGGTHVRKGTWLLAVRVLDDELWMRIRSGDISGLSIGGTARRGD